MLKRGLPAAAIATASVAVLLGLIYVGSRGLKDFDSALAGYAVASVFALAASVYRYTRWITRPPTWRYFRAGWANFLSWRNFRRYTLLIPLCLVDTTSSPRPSSASAGSAAGSRTWRSSGACCSRARSPSRSRSAGSASATWTVPVPALVLRHPDVLASRPSRRSAGCLVPRAGLHRAAADRGAGGRILAAGHRRWPARDPALRLRPDAAGAAVRDRRDRPGAHRVVALVGRQVLLVHVAVHQVTVVAWLIVAAVRQVLPHRPAAGRDRRDAVPDRQPGSRALRTRAVRPATALRCGGELPSEQFVERPEGDARRPRPALQAGTMAHGCAPGLLPDL